MFVYIAGLQWFHLPHSLDAICTPFTLYEYWFTPKSNQHQIYFKTVIWYEPMILNLNDWHWHCSGSGCSSFSSRWKGGADALESQWEGQGLEYGPSLDPILLRHKDASKVESLHLTYIYICVYHICIIFSRSTTCFKGLKYSVKKTSASVVPFQGDVVVLTFVLQFLQAIQFWGKILGKDWFKLEDWIPCP